MSRDESSTQPALGTVDATSTQSAATESSSSSSSNRFSLPVIRHKRNKSRTTTEPLSADTGSSSRRSFFRSRSKSPAPPSHTNSLPVKKSHGYSRSRDGHLHAATVGGSASPSRITFQEVEDGDPIERTTSPTAMSLHAGTSASPSPYDWESRHRSHSGSHANSYTSRKSSSDYKRLSGTVNHRGRHANDWLFGGFSVRESVGKLWRDDEK